MGHVRHKLLVITSWSADAAGSAWTKARDIWGTDASRVVSAPIQSIINSYWTVVLTTSGSKSRWGERQVHDSRLDEMLSWLRSTKTLMATGYLEWVLVEYGWDDEEAVVSAHRWDGKHTTHDFVGESVACELCGEERGYFLHGSTDGVTDAQVGGRAGEGTEDCPEIFRVSGEMTCELCGKLYRKHPHDMDHLSWDGHPFLRIGCDGLRYKL